MRNFPPIMKPKSFNEFFLFTVILVAISKTDENDLSEEIYLLNEELSKFSSETDILYFPKVIKTSAVDLTGWQILCYLLRAMKEDINDCKTDDLYW